MIGFEKSSLNFQLDDSLWIRKNLTIPTTDDLITEKAELLNVIIQRNLCLKCQMQLMFKCALRS